MPPKTSHYETVSDHDDSNTEVEDSLMGDEKEQHTSHQWQSIDLDARPGSSPNGRTWRARWRRCMALLKKYRWAIDTLLLLTNIGLSLGLSLLMYYQFEDARYPASVQQVGGDYAGASPIFPTKVVKWDADYAYVPPNATEFLSNNTLNSWKSMLPAGAGWKPLTADPFFTTSMTHQLHCLFMMGGIYSAITTNATHKLMPDYDSHYFHCVDYLRQAVMCNADMALEPHLDTDPDDNGPGDGSWSGQHVCKDYSQVIRYLDRQIADGVRVVLPVDD